MSHGSHLQSFDETELYVLAIGAHPDDTDIGCSGTLAKFAAAGHRVGVLDLTMAEMSSNGTVILRQQEAMAASAILGLSVRLTLSLPDRGLTRNHHENIRSIVDVIRKYRPKYVFAPDWEDRHPDHRQAAELVEEAVFSARLNRYAVPSGAVAHRVQQILYYSINGMPQTQLAIDITNFQDKKEQALAAYGSQFDPACGQTPTPLNQGFLEAIRGRDALVGHQVGVRYAEGFRSKQPVLLQNLG